MNADKRSNDKRRNEEALQNFLLDIDCLNELNIWTEKFNLFDVLKISHTEIRHSNMLAWLFDANENHGMGDKFIKKIVQRLVKNDIQNKYDVYKLLLLDFYSFTVYREWNNIDLLIVSDKEKTVIIIENKVGSNEHSNQLNRYRKICESVYADYNRVYLFLTPDGTAPSDTENWGVLTYHDVVEILEDIKKNTELLPDIALMINNYIDVIRRDIVDDEQLIEVCNKIYNKHKKALDLIYNNRYDKKNVLKETVRNTLLKLCDKGKVIYDGNNSLSFYSDRMNSVLPLLSKENSIWKTKYPYRYFVSITDESRISIIFEISSVNVSSDTLDRMSVIIDLLKPSDTKRSEFDYKRLHRINIELISEDIVEELNTKLCECIDNLAVWEERLIKQYNSKLYNEQ